MVAGPLDKGLDEDIYNEKISLSWDKKSVSEFFQTNYEWVGFLFRIFWLQEGFGLLDPILNMGPMF